MESWNTQSLEFTYVNNLLPLISCQPPLSDVIAKHFISYVQRCLTSDCDIVNYVVHMVYGLAVWPHLWDVVCSIAVTNMVLLPMTLRVCQLKVLTNTFYRMLVWCYIHARYIHTVDIARMLLELIFIRDGSLYVDLPCFANDVLFLISYLSTMWFF